jgi:translocation and assembly module TamB
LDENNRPTENQYEINLLVQGRAPDVQISLTSQPSLPERDIVSLLALGLTPDALDERRTSGQQAANTSTAIAGALLQKPVGRKLKDTLGVDVKVSSTQPTADTASTPQVTFTKQWTPKFGASASGTLEANPTSSVKLEYKMSRGLSVIGSWEGRDQGANQIVEKKDASPSVLGLDLEYKVQFK